MNTEIPIRTIDKSAWGDGPWSTEPDRLEWAHAGLPCLAVRGPDFGGQWCGYVAVPPGHPLHGKHYDTPDVEVHGGLTYADACRGDICHVPKPGEPDDVWWFGFDCGHFRSTSCRRWTRGCVTAASHRSGGRCIARSSTCRRKRIASRINSRR